VTIFEACAWRGQLALSAHILYHNLAPRALHARFFKYRTLEVHAVCLAGATGAHAGYLHCAIYVAISLEIFGIYRGGTTVHQ
jgi:hypothetical protein